VTKKNIIQTIKTKEMDRKEFLKYSGIALLGVIGIKGIISLLSPSNERLITGSLEKNERRGFGSRKYGE